MDVLEAASFRNLTVSVFPYMYYDRFPTSRLQNVREHVNTQHSESSAELVI